MGKKSLCVILTFFFVVVLFSCSNTTNNLEMAKRKLDIIYQENDNANYVTQDITLVSNSMHNTTVIWESSNIDVIDIDGTVNRPQFGEGDVEVRLIATLKLNDRKTIKEFDLIVKEINEKEILNEVYENLEVEFNSQDNINSVTSDLILKTNIGKVNIT